MGTLRRALKAHSGTHSSGSLETVGQENWFRDAKSRYVATYMPCGSHEIR